MNLLIDLLIAINISFGMPDKSDSVASHPANQNQKPLFSFGIIADVQYADYEPAGTRFYRLSTDKLKEAVNSFKEDSVNFIINLGDIIDRDFESYKPVMDIINSSGLKTYNITGNHDYAVDSRFKKRLPVLSSSKDGYYSVNYKNFRFIFLNGNEVSTYISNNKSAIKQATDYISVLKQKGEINAIDWNGGISTKQLAWLDNQLTEATGKNEKVFIICHFPVVPENEHNLLNYKDVLPVLEKYQNIIAWFNGHNHAGNYGNFNMIHFVTFKGMVETETTNSFALVEVYNNKLWIRGSGREKSQILAY
jgi:manganese-dependent ADP-ribose/CDP-alcohol diphosphatase